MNLDYGLNATYNPANPANPVNRTEEINDYGILFLDYKITL